MNKMISNTSISLFQGVMRYHIFWNKSTIDLRSWHGDLERKDIVAVHGFKGSAPPLATEVDSLIKKMTLALPSHIRGVQGFKVAFLSPDSILAT